jgi:hypothetical protein
MSRLAYHRELFSSALLPVMLTALQGGTMAVIVKKMFTDVPEISTYQLNTAVGLVAASRSIGHLTSLLWASYSRGKPKVRFIQRLQLLTASIVAAMAFASHSAAGLWYFTTLCISGWIAWSGVVTLRAGVWRANYHHTHRATIAGKISTLRALILAIMGITVGLCLDARPDSYRFLFPMIALFGAAGATVYGRLPFRRQSQQLALEHATPANMSSYSPLVIYKVLKEDWLYRGYMACMFVMGVGNLMVQPILAIVLEEQFQVSYITGIAIATVIPLLAMTLCIPFWGRLLERSHVIDFRTLHVWVFAFVAILDMIGMWSDQIAFFYLAAVVQGIGWGGGVLAWNLGHQHFAPRDRDAEYMGVHITLTGIRGFIGPMLAVQLYMWLLPRGWQVGSFGVCLLANLLGGIGFLWLAKQRQRIMASE